MKRIVIVFDGLGMGGIERVGISYIKLLLELGYKVDVVNLRPEKNSLEHQIPHECEIKHIKYPVWLAPEYYAKAIKMWWWGRFAYPIAYIFTKGFTYLYKVFRPIKGNYDIAIAFAGHFNDLTYVAENLVASDKKVCWLHGALVSYLMISDGFFNLYKKILNLVVLVDAAQDVTLQFNSYLKLNIVKIYNPICLDKGNADASNVSLLKERFGIFAIMVARFACPKDQMTVIKAIEIVNQKYKKDINLVLLGDGPTFKSIEEYCNNNRLLNNKVFLEGTKLNVQDYYAAATISVFASFSEGLPTVLLESLIFEIPVVATDCFTGPREILGNNEYGVLSKVNNAESMAYEINHLLENKELYEKYKNRAKKRLDDFMPCKIKKQLEKFFDNLY